MECGPHEVGDGGEEERADDGVRHQTDVDEDVLLEVRGGVVVLRSGLWGLGLVVVLRLWMIWLGLRGLRLVGEDFFFDYFDFHAEFEVHYAVFVAVLSFGFGVLLPGLVGVLFGVFCCPWLDLFQPSFLSRRHDLFLEPVVDAS